MLGRGAGLRRRSEPRGFGLDVNPSQNRPSRCSSTTSVVVHSPVTPAAIAIRRNSARSKGAMATDTTPSSERGNVLGERPTGRPPIRSARDRVEAGCRGSPTRRPVSPGACRRRCLSETSTGRTAYSAGRPEVSPGAQSPIGVSSRGASSGAYESTRAAVSIGQHLAWTTNWGDRRPVRLALSYPR